MTLEVTDEARRFIAEQGFDPVYGARPLRRFIAREVETRIGRALLAGDVQDGAVIRVDVGRRRAHRQLPRSPGERRVPMTATPAEHRQVPELRPAQPGAGRGRAASRAAATATSRCPGSRTPPTTTSPRSRRRRGSRCWSTCGRPGAGRAAWSAPRWSSWPRIAGRLKLVKVNVDESPRLSERFAVQAIPTLLVLRDGQVMRRQAGAAPAPALRAWLDGALAAEPA